MLTDKEGSKDGINERKFVSGQTYNKSELGDFLFSGWLEQGALKVVEEKKEESIKPEKQVKPELEKKEKAVIKTVEEKQVKSKQKADKKKGDK